MRARRALAATLAVLAFATGCERTAAGPDAMVVADDSRLRRTAAALLPRVAALSGLEVRGPVRLAREGPDQVRRYVAEQLEAELPPAEIEGVRTAYALLGLLPDTLDLRGLLIELYSEQIIGYYDPDRRTLLVVEGVTGEEVRTVLAHELVHALQHQYANLDSLIARERGNDRQMAAQAALEGHAMLVTLVIAAEEQLGGPVDPASLPDPGPALRAGLQSQNERFPVFQRAPAIIRETLLFPYAAGAEFVQTVWRTLPGSPPPLDSLMPQSTEQVLHPTERFLMTRDAPVDIVFAADTGHVYENTLGELETGLFLTVHLGAGADTLAYGWGGDRYRVFDTPAGPALVWASVWDDAAAADRFHAAAAAALEAGSIDGAAERLDVDGAPVVRVIAAGSAAALARVPRPDLRVIR